MSGSEIARTFRARIDRSPGQMSTATITTSNYAERLAGVLRDSYGDNRSAAKVVAEKIGAGLGTVRKWFAGENGADAVHLIKLMADDDEVFRTVCELAGRLDAADAGLALAKLREMKKLLEGIE